MALRVSLLIAAITLLLLALDAGLGLMGVVVFWPRLTALHGPLMVASFFGTLLALERAVGLNRSWTYLAPGLMGLGGLVLAFVGAGLGALFLVAGAAAYVLTAGYVYQLQPADFTLAMAFGALLLLLGDLSWLFGASWDLTSLLWAGFLALIIFGERLELSRFVSKAGYCRNLVPDHRTDPGGWLPDLLPAT